MTYLEKVMSAIKFDDELLTADEIEWLRKTFSWQIQDNICPSGIKFLKGQSPLDCINNLTENCRGQCWDTEAAE